MATPTAVSDGQFIWAMFGTGDLACLDNDGKVLWQRNLVKEYGEYIYFMNGQGNCTVVRAADKLEILAKNEFNEPTLSTPAISNGALFIRTEASLYCVAN